MPNRFAERERQGGATLVELTISIVIFSIALAGVMLAMSTTISHSADPMVEHQAIAIAETYMEEILQRPFNETLASTNPENFPNPDPGELNNRAAYDDVNDYNGLINAQVQDITGNPVLPLANYSVTVTVVPDGNLGPAAGPWVPDADAWLVTVTVSHNLRILVTLNGHSVRPL